MFSHQNKNLETQVQAIQQDSATTIETTNELDDPQPLFEKIMKILVPNNFKPFSLETFNQKKILKNTSLCFNT